MKITPEAFYLMARPVLEAGRVISFIVAGDSMLPFLHDGDEVTLKRSERYRRGDIVLASSYPAGKVVLHYVAEDAGDTLILMGSANLKQVEYCRMNDVAGRVESPHICRGGLLLWHRLLPVRRYLLWLYRFFSRCGS